MDTQVEGRLSGTRDMFPEDHKYLTFLKKVFRHEFRKNGFRRISTPSMEDISLLRKIYPVDANNYGIYAFQDKQDSWIWLLPTASVWIIRSYLEHEKFEELQPVYYYYMDKFFRQDRKRKEYYTIGAEVIGESDPIIDAQNMYIVYSALQKIGLANDIFIRVNSYGAPKEMVKYEEELQSFFENKKWVMSPETQEKYQTNVFAPFHSSHEDDIILAASAPSITNFFKKDSKKYYETLVSYLDDLDIPYKKDHTLFFDDWIYSHGIWQIENKKWDIIAYGGRYDDLASSMGSPKPYGASGFSIDTDALISMIQDNHISLKDKDSIDLYFVQLGDEAKKVVFPLSLQARERGINTQASLGTPSMKEQMLKAQRIWATYIVIVGVMEARNWVFQVRNIEAGTQEEVKKEELIDYIIDKIGKDQLDFYEPSLDLLKGEPPISDEKKEAE